jgi:Protein of unknown function (DUF2794)
MPTGASPNNGHPAAVTDIEPADDNGVARLGDHLTVRPPPLGLGVRPPSARGAAETVAFDRSELNAILILYGRKVADGEWRDYAIDFTAQKAVFSVFRRTSEFALYRIEKNPKSARKQGAYAVIAATGLVLKRGHDLRRVLDVLDTKLKLISS